MFRLSHFSYESGPRLFQSLELTDQLGQTTDGSGEFVRIWRSPGSGAVAHNRASPISKVTQPAAGVELKLLIDLQAEKKLKNVYMYTGIGQYQIFSKTPYFSAKKHTTVVLKEEV